MSIQIGLIGDIMLGRFVAERYAQNHYQLISSRVKANIEKFDICIANLESPIVSGYSDDSLRFAANIELLEQFKWVDCFSLSNNHINDFGSKGMEETINALNSNGVNWNGLYEKEYYPFLIEKCDEKIAVITCADMMNYEFSNACPYKTLRVNRPQEIENCITNYKTQGYYVILYAHVGMLFTRFPNPVIRDFLHQMADCGADCIVTVHPHCLGGYENYNGKFIVYSLGDFLMDGASFRRRKAGILRLNVDNGKLKNWELLPVQTTDELQVCLPDEKMAKRMLRDFEDVSAKIRDNSTNYIGFYKKQYKKELLSHSWSTIQFEYHRRGLKGLTQILIKRIGAVKGMALRVFTDRSTMSYDADAVEENNISINDIR